MNRHMAIGAWIAFVGTVAFFAWLVLLFSPHAAAVFVGPLSIAVMFTGLCWHHIAAWWGHFTRDRVATLLAARAAEERLTQAYEDQAIRLATCGPHKPCDPEENYLCVWHRTKPHVYVGWDHCDRCYCTFEMFQHQPSYGPEPVVGRCEWSDDMEKRFAE